MQDAQYGGWRQCLICRAKKRRCQSRSPRSGIKNFEEVALGYTQEQGRA